MCLREAAEQFLGTSFGLFHVVRRSSDFYSFHVVFGVSHGWKPQIWWLIIIFCNWDSGFLRKYWKPQGLMFDHDHFPIWNFKYIYNWVLNAVCSGTPAVYFWTTDTHIQQKPNLHVVGGMSGEKLQTQTYRCSVSTLSLSKLQTWKFCAALWGLPYLYRLWPVDQRSNSSGCWIASIAGLWGTRNGDGYGDKSRPRLSPWRCTWLTMGFGGSSNTFKIRYLFAAVWFSGFGRRKMIPFSNGAPTEKENSGWQNIVLENLVIYHQMPNMPMAHIHWYNCPTCLKYWAVVPISVKKCNQVVLWPSRLDLSVAFQSESIGQHLQSG